MEPGTRYETMPIPPVPEHTEYVPAGAVVFAVEFRFLTDDILDAAYEGDEAGTAIMDAARPDSLDDRGVSVHVFDAATNVEYLRFDCFDDDPHYHYITSAEGYQRYVRFDTWAQGDMFTWAVACLRTRVGEMLAAAGAAVAAANVDLRTVGTALDALEELARVLPERVAARSTQV